MLDCPVSLRRKRAKCGKQEGSGERRADEPQECADSRSGLANGALIERHRIERKVQGFEYPSSPPAVTPQPVNGHICTMNRGRAVQRLEYARASCPMSADTPD